MCVYVCANVWVVVVAGGGGCRYRYESYQYGAGSSEDLLRSAHGEPADKGTESLQAIHLVLLDLLTVQVKAPHAFHIAEDSLGAYGP
jgi:hypothetical protein